MQKKTLNNHFKSAISNIKNELKKRDGSKNRHGSVTDFGDQINIDSQHINLDLNSRIQTGDSNRGARASGRGGSGFFGPESLGPSSSQHSNRSHLTQQSNYDSL